MTNDFAQIADPRLFPAALQGFQNAYAPYSEFQVGAAILADDANIYAGGNVENAAYPQGNCAEASAIAAMIYGGARQIMQILVIGQSKELVMPCGGCRQRLAEFCHDDAQIFIGSPQAILKAFTVDEIFPHQFGKASL